MTLIHQVREHAMAAAPVAPVLAAALDNIADGFFALDQGGRLVYANPAAARLLQPAGAGELSGAINWTELDGVLDGDFGLHCQAAVGDDRTVVFDSFCAPLERWFEVHACPSATGLAVYLRDITAYRQAREAARESEERFSSVVRASASAVWDWDLKSDTIDWNEGIENLFGFSAQDIEAGSESWTSRIHHEDRARVVQGIHAVMDGPAQRQYWTDEYRFLCKDGSFAFVLDHGFVIRNDSGEAVRMVGAMNNLSESRNAESDARRAAETHAAILQVQHRIASVDLDLQAVMTLMAERAQTLTGADGGVVELVEDDEMVYRATAGIAARQIGLRLKVGSSLSGSAMRAGMVLHCEDAEVDSRVDRDASRAIGIRSLIAAPLRVADQVVGVLKVMAVAPHAFRTRDLGNLEILVESLGAVIQRHRDAERLRQSEAQYRLLFEHNPHPMWVFEEATLRILAVNHSAIRHYGYAKQEFLAMTLRDLRPPEDLAIFEDAVSALVHDQKSFAVWRHRKKDGTLIDVEVTSDGIDFNGLPARLVLASDVTERMRAERELARVNRAQQMLSACHEALIRAEQEATLLEEICRVTVEIGGYRMAWVGFALEDRARSIVPAAHFGGDADYLDRIQGSWSADHPAGHGPGGRTIRAGRVVVVENLALDAGFKGYLEPAQARGFRSLVCLPLRDSDRAFGLLSLYSAEVAQVSADEIKLLQALADDLAFGINNIRIQDERRRLQLGAVKVAAGVSASTGTEFFEQLTRNMADAVGAHAGYLARLLPGEPRVVRTIAAVRDSILIGNFDYPLAGTPCEKVFQDQQFVASSDVASLFPDASPRYASGAHAYVGCRLDNSTGQPVGLLFVLFREPLTRFEFIESTMRIFAARAAAELERQEADARIRAQASLLDKATDAIIVRGLDARVLFWNKGAEHLYGWSAEEAIGSPVGEVIHSHSIGVEEMTRRMMEDGEWTNEMTVTRKDGVSIEIEAHLTLVQGDDGEPASILSISNDITQRKAAQAEIQNLAFYDPLTQLPNRLLLMDRLQHAMASSVRNHCEGALLFIDLDDFKTLNDTLGHDIGDLLLRQVAVRLISSVRESDTVARLGGDEFVVILENLHQNPVLAAAQAQSVGEKILASISRPYVLDDSEQYSSCSIGITLFADHQNNLNDLLKRADLAMYQSKASGRNTLRFFNSDMQADVTARAVLEADLRHGLKDNQFVLFYQPQLDEARGLTGAEALVRWRHPRRGMVSPGEFIALAEETGLILPLGQWVLEAACAQLAAWASQPETAALTIAVNVSVRQFRHADFVDQVLAVLAASGASPHQLKLELTESLLVDNVEATIAKMSALKARGVSFSLDDFGTGYSSLTYLKRLPLDQLKIDQSFVKDVLTDPNDAVIARTIIALGQSLGLAVIAEGVETEAQREFLAASGCHFYQGYLFSKPLPVKEFEAYRQGRIKVMAL